MSERLINGLHHVTALASNPQRNVDFYTGILGLRFIKKTINFDAPDVYHLYYGDEAGSPGTIMTFFPYVGIPKGRKGTGQLTYTAFTIDQGALSFWMDRLAAFNIPFEGPKQRFEEKYLTFEDFDGLGVELVAVANDPRQGWANDIIPAEFAVKGFHTVTLHEASADRTVQLLTEQMQHKLIAEEAGRFRFEAGQGGGGNYVDVLYVPNSVKGLQGAGTVHHVAFSTENDETQLAIREKVLSMGFQATPVIDRNYFHSIYFREPGNILFEIATNPPGFTVDETLEQLGSKLQLPPWQEPNRGKIEQILDPIEPKVWAAPQR
ncbi:MAG TPA: ring-cleaving dioxygenase [Microscillaceae bacterium]|jgi:glyoxalase family protein|nr:ring-cleaving dioxygenase [Microscillaceae bacterium]